MEIHWEIEVCQRVVTDRLRTTALEIIIPSPLQFRGRESHILETPWLLANNEHISLRDRCNFGHQPCPGWPVNELL